MKHNDEIMPVMGSIDYNNPRSLVNIAPNKIRSVIDNLSMEYLEMSEYELEQIVETNPFVNRIRTAFWQEYERAQGEVRNMNIYNISGMVGTTETHIYRVMRDDKCAAWILCPPTTYTIFLDEALTFGLKRLRDNILTLPIKDEFGNVDKDNCNIIMKAVAFLDMRKNGAVVQKTMNLNVNATKADMKDVQKEMSMLDLDKKIKELEERQANADKRTGELEVVEAETA